ncbi:MAG: nucleoside triphosphate pyrophosphohydrolase [Chloroflexi bacterium]|nr:nucleoside triphosphate pyrophosphohydrolase [Chloroflexota bacterium]
MTRLFLLGGCVMGLTIVGLGPGDGRYLTREAWQILTEAQALYLRTSYHPAVADLPDTIQTHSFDAVYETADSFAAVYNEIVSTLLQKVQTEDIVYAVPGHPHVGESTVTRLVTAAAELGLAVRVVSGLSFVEPSLTAVNVDALDGLQLYDAIELAQYHYPPINPDTPLLLGQVYSRLLAGELKMALTAVYPDEHSVILIHAAGTAVEIIEPIPLYEIDRSPHINHLTSLFVPPLPYPSSLTTLAETVAHLRSPEGCPWDQEQTPQSMRSGLQEEASEVLDALDANNYDGLCEELGDMFYHLVMQAQMAAEMETFNLSDVLAGIEAKLKRRHPHVWGDWDVADSEHVVRNWEMLKQGEKPKKQASILDNVPKSLPALAQSQKIQAKVKQVGFDWAEISGVYDKLDEELAELRNAETIEEQAEELGDLLFVVTNVAKWLGIDAESALRVANSKFSHRFRAVEQLALQRGVDMTQMDLAQLDVLWQEVKAASVS